MGPQMSTNSRTFDFLKFASRERRDEKRAICQLEGQCRPMDSLQLSAAWPVSIRDMSRSGFQLLLSRRFEPGTLLVVDVHDAEGQATRMLLARVVRVSSLAKGRWVLGCTFTVPLTPEDLDSLLKPSPRMPNKKAS
jgi:PilZ domain-containing protein